MRTLADYKILRTSQLQEFDRLSNINIAIPEIVPDIKKFLSNYWNDYNFTFPSPKEQNLKVLMSYRPEYYATV